MDKVAELRELIHTHMMDGSARRALHRFADKLASTQGDAVGVRYRYRVERPDGSGSEWTDWRFAKNEREADFGVPTGTPAEIRPLYDRPQPASADVVDARRWRALIGSARVRVLGSAGLMNPDGSDPNGNPWNGRAHIGLELWTRHEAAPNEPTNAVEWVTKYADIAALELAPVVEGVT